MRDQIKMNAHGKIGYLNDSNLAFKKVLNGEIYVDKSSLLTKLNSRIGTDNCYICVSRPRRFGKSVTAKMIAAYYGREQDSSALFNSLEIAKHPSYKKHLNKYNTLFINMTDELNNSHKDIELMLTNLSSKIIHELKENYPQLTFNDPLNLELSLNKVFNECGIFFVVIIDEWDCILREKKNDTEGLKRYLEWLKILLKDKTYLGLAYMTGILPIKKYGTQSALNMFDEFSMLDPSVFAQYIGFTANEVMSLCDSYHIDYQNMQKWYDGYCFKKTPHIYNPSSVVRALARDEFKSYWTQTETFESLKAFVDLNFDGLQDEIVKLLANESILIDYTTFSNDMSSFATKDDVLTLLLHLGYLSLQPEDDYLPNGQTYDDNRLLRVHIPNQEIKNEFISTMRQNARYAGVYELINASYTLLNDICNQKCEAVARSFDKVHEENTSILKYNDENSLACVISLSLLLCSRDLYTVKREMAAGKGFADLVYIPKAGVTQPALLIELKYDQSAQTAIDQIKNKQYPNVFSDYHGEVLLVGINYDKITKTHECLIEKYNRDNFGTVGK